MEFIGVVDWLLQHVKFYKFGSLRPLHIRKLGNFPSIKFTHISVSLIFVLNALFTLIWVVYYVRKKPVSNLLRISTMSKPNFNMLDEKIFVVYFYPNLTTLLHYLRPLHSDNPICQKWFLKWTTWTLTTRKKKTQVPQILFPWLARHVRCLQYRQLNRLVSRGVWSRVRCEFFMTGPSEKVNGMFIQRLERTIPSFWPYH